MAGNILPIPLRRESQRETFTPTLPKRFVELNRSLASHDHIWTYESPSTDYPVMSNGPVIGSSDRERLLDAANRSSGGLIVRTYDVRNSFLIHPQSHIARRGA